MGVQPSAVRETEWGEILRPVASAGARSPAVLLLSAEPAMAIGHDAFLAEAWSAWGGRALPVARGYPQMSLEDLFALQPRSILLVGAVDPASALAKACAQRGIAFEGIEDGRLLRPGPALREGLRAWRARLAGEAP
jgi:hypothetical protein